MEGTAPRFERRAWAAVFPGLPDPSAEPATEEIYLLRPGRPDFKLKLRNGSLELKALMLERDGLQQWRPLAKLGFPLSADGLRELGIEPADATAVYTDFGALSPAIERTGLVTVPLMKRRLLFERRGCRAETTLVESGGHRSLTAAAEDVDPDRVRRAAAEMGLGRFPNLAYPGVLLAWWACETG